MKEGDTMITSMSLTNFKSWSNVNVPLGQISVFFGTNSSGKTSLLQSLLALKQTAASFDRKRAFYFGGEEKDLVDFGTFRDVVYGHDVTRGISVTLDWNLPVPVPFGTTTPVTSLHYEVGWQLVADEVVISNLLYRADPVRFGMTRRDDATYDFQAESILRRQGRPWPLSTAPDSCYAIPREAAREARNIDLLEFNHQFELLMGRIAYLGPLREYPHRRYTWTGAAPQIIDPRGRGTVEALLAAERQQANGKSQQKRKSSSLVERVATWLKRFQLSERFYLAPVDRDKRIYEARLQARGAEAIITDVGFGVSQVLPIIVLLHFVPEGSIVLLEQPEIHLHPLVQAEMADLFLETAHERNLQLIIESHSEHLLRRLQRRIAEAELPLASPEFIRLYFCELSSQGSTLRQVETDMFGSILNWPERFFGDEAGDLDAMTRAALRRKKDLMSRG